MGNAEDEDLATNNLGIVSSEGAIYLEICLGHNTIVNTCVVLKFGVLFLRDQAERQVYSGLARVLWGPP